MGKKTGSFESKDFPVVKFQNSKYGNFCWQDLFHTKYIFLYIKLTLKWYNFTNRKIPCKLIFSKSEYKLSHIIYTVSLNLFSLVYSEVFKIIRLG